MTISAPLAALPDLIDGWEQVMKSVRINGNAEMADALGFVFRNLRWDPEADLAGVVGDVAAHRLHRGALRLLTGQATAAKAIGDNLIEYLTIERNVLLERASLSQHASDLEGVERFCCAPGKARRRCRAQVKGLPPIREPTLLARVGQLPSNGPRRGRHGANPVQLRGRIALPIGK